MNSRESYPIDEFASFELQEDKENAVFRITLKGPLRFSAMIADKIGNLRFTKKELDEWGKEQMT